MEQRFVGFSSKNQQRTDIPPPEVWLHNPNRPLLETPLDNRGLVDFETLVHLVRGTVDPAYDWSSPLNDRHHLQWPRRFYVDAIGSKPNPAEFRHLSIGMVRVPRYFHNWTHLITEPPAMPSFEVMQYRIDAQRVAVSLFERVLNIKREARSLSLGQEAYKVFIADRLSQKFDDFSRVLNVATSQPIEFQPIDYSAIELKKPVDMIRLADKLAKKAIYRCAVRDICEPVAA